MRGDVYIATDRGITYLCDTCGKFVSPQGAGVSWSQTWSQTWDGPDLHDPVYRCSSCTDIYGIRHTNCGQPHLYQGRNPLVGEE